MNDCYIITEDGCWRGEFADARKAHDAACRMRARLASQGYYDAVVRVLTGAEYGEMVAARIAARKAAG